MKIAVIGGGTTGVLALAALTQLNQSHEITQFYSSKSGAIGVGEATIPETTSFMDSIGLNSLRIMKECNASFKTGVKFENWGHDTTSKFWFVFGDDLTGLHNTRAEKAPQKVIEYIENQALGKPFKTPRIGMHFNTAELHNLEIPGITKIDKVLNENDKSNLIKEFDVILDCSGFNQFFKTQHSSDATLQELTNNQALAIRIPHTNDLWNPGTSTFHNYSTFYAAENGWIWNIPTQKELSIGYVHNSNTDVSIEFSKFLKDRYNFDTKIQSPRTIKFKNYASLNPYRIESNGKHSALICNLGLSSCFIEPLQSTGLYLTIFGIKRMLEILKGTISPDEANSALLSEFLGTSTFVAGNLKYCKRNSEYWKKFNDIKINEAHLELSSVFTKYETEQLYASIKSGYTKLDGTSKIDINSIPFWRIYEKILGNPLGIENY